MVRILVPATATYRGKLTSPERWNTWEPREGDILVCTPPKCGTTWTQTILAMLLNGGPDLPDTLGAVSPWIDADLGVSAEEVVKKIAALPGRRVLKTHTPGDGFPVWEGVTVVAVYRHPLDLFFSLRKHVANRHVDADHPMKAPASVALASFLDRPMNRDDFDNDSLETVTHHYRETARSGRIPGLLTLHYSDMSRDPRATVRRLAEAADIDADDVLIDAVTEATDINVMRAQADRYVPVGGTGFWRSEAGFFATGGTGNWQGKLTDVDVDAYHRRLSEFLPDPVARHWLEDGNGSLSEVESR